MPKSNLFTAVVYTLQPAAISSTGSATAATAITSCHSLFANHELLWKIDQVPYYLFFETNISFWRVVGLTLSEVYSEPCQDLRLGVIHVVRTQNFPKS